MGRLLPLLVLTVVWLSPSQAAAQERRAGGGDQALKRAQYMLRLVSQEKTELETRLAKLEGEMKDLERELEKLEVRNEGLEARLAQAGEANDRLVERIRSDADKYRDLLGRYRETVNTLKQANADNQHLVKAVHEREGWIARCEERNQGLYAANRDLMGRYREAGFAVTEGILGLKRVEIENEVQDYRFRIEDLRVTPFSPEGNMTRHVRQADQGLPQQPVEGLN